MFSLITMRAERVWKKRNEENIEKTKLALGKHLDKGGEAEVESKADSASNFSYCMYDKL